jgi:iron-sulfur cluster assembly protein
MASTTYNLEITGKALSELGRLGVNKENFLRIRVVAGGCSGMTYSAAIETTIEEGDEVVYQHDVFRIVADAGSLLFLDGLQVDFSNDLVQAGFRFKNTNASGSCGCGSSFSV